VYTHHIWRPQGGGPHTAPVRGQLKLLHNSFLSFRQLKCGESHMTYLARNTVNRIGSFKLNNSMTTQHKNVKSISGGSQNDALPMYIL
jgi:hypothetical protein